jgi:hypothetical protein
MYSIINKLNIYLESAKLKAESPRYDDDASKVMMMCPLWLHFGWGTLVVLLHK